MGGKFGFYRILFTGFQGYLDQVYHRRFYFSRAGAFILASSRYYMFQRSLLFYLWGSIIFEIAHHCWWQPAGQLAMIRLPTYKTVQESEQWRTTRYYVRGVLLRCGRRRSGVHHPPRLRFAHIAVHKGGYVVYNQS